MFSDLEKLVLDYAVGMSMAPAEPWRGPPVEWAVLVPFLSLYFFGHMFLWWPLSDLAREAWTVYLVLFTVNTGLNIQGHARPGSRTA